MTAIPSAGGIDNTTAAAVAVGGENHSAAAANPAFPYPTTLFLLWSLHALYYLQRTAATTRGKKVQTNQHRRRRNNSLNRRRRNPPPPLICYDDLVLRRRYDKLLWLALRTTTARTADGDRYLGDSSVSMRQQHQYDDDDDNRNHEAVVSTTGVVDLMSSSSPSLTIPLGNTSTNLPVENGLPSSTMDRRRQPQQQHEQYAAYHVMWNAMVKRAQYWSKSVGGDSVVRLFYYTHLIWSCRALETHFNSSSSVPLMLSYLSAIGTVLTLSSLVRIGLIHYVLVYWEQHRPECAVLRSVDLSSSPMRLCGPLLVTFQLIFPHMALPVVPYFHKVAPYHHYHVIVPAVSWIVLLLFIWWDGSIREFVEGMIVTYGWVRLGSPLLVGPVVLLALFALVSHRWLCDSVGWDRRTGQLRIYNDETRQWTLYEPYLTTEVDARTDYNAMSDDDDDNDFTPTISNNNDDDDDNNSMADDDTSTASNTIELRPRRRLHRNENDDMDADETVPLVDHIHEPSAAAAVGASVWRTSRSNEVRSRRGGGGGNAYHPNAVAAMSID